MSDAKQPSLLLIGLIYFCFYVMGLCIVFGILVVLISQTSFNPTGAGMGIVIPLIAAMQSGMIYYRKAGELPTGAYLWQAAGVMTLVAAAIAVFQLWAAVRLDLFEAVAPGFSLSNPQDRNIVVIVMAVMLAVVLLVNFFAFRSGARGGRKQEERLRLRAERKAAKLAAKKQG